MYNEIPQKVKECVLRLEPEAEVILFGSRARNDSQQFSDWDFLVLVDGKVDTGRADRIRHSLYEIEWDTGEVISTIIKSRQIWNSPLYQDVPLRQAVEREGILLVKEQPGDISRYFISRAIESLDEAKLLADAGHWNTCVNRLYYACFYAASAILAGQGLSSSKHSGIRSIFNSQIVKSGIIPRSIAAIYNDLFDRRQESDYGPFFSFEESDVKPWFADAELFVDTLLKLMK